MFSQGRLHIGSLRSLKVAVYPSLHSLNFVFSSEEQYSRILIYLTFNVGFKQGRERMHFKIPITISSPDQYPEFQMCTFSCLTVSVNQESGHSLAKFSGSGSLTKLQPSCPPGLHSSQGSWGRIHLQVHSHGC